MSDTRGEPDRVTYSYEHAVKEYGNGFSVHVSYATDVLDGESANKAMLRASKIVEARVERDVKRIKKQREA